MPQQLIIPVIQKLTVKAAKTTTQPKPPSGIAVVLNAPGPLGVEVVVGVGDRGGVCVSSSWQVTAVSEKAADFGKEESRNVEGLLEVVVELAEP